MLFSKSAADDTQRVRVKICGITREDDVVAAVDAGADSVGFICYAGSPRFVSPSRLMSLASLVPPSVTKVLLFVNPKAEEVREYLSFVPDATLQFHGNESRAFCDQFHVRYIKAVSIDKPERLTEAQNDYPMAAALLADAAGVTRGGTGTSFDWQAVASVRSRITKPLIVAGGLTAENVCEAIRTLSPWAVDVASGVESAVGVKDPAKITAFMEAVNNAGDVAACEEARD